MSSVPQHIKELMRLARKEPDTDLKELMIDAIRHYWTTKNEITLGRKIPMSALASNEKMARIEPWNAELDPDEVRHDVDSVDDILAKTILNDLEKRGLSIIRITAQSPDNYVIRAVAKLIGPLAPKQNDYKGDIKMIQPKPSGASFSGDTLADLGLHVDGTQHNETPCVMIFHYIAGAKVGAMSVFVDTTKALLDIDGKRRNELLINLARPDAATFSKKGMVHTGPIIYFSPTNSLVCRVRFDDVIKVNPKCRSDFNLLKKAFNDPKYRLEFRPRNGDIIVFDNWRILHARDEVFGLPIRQHWRAWITALKPTLLPKYYLGIRPVTAATAAKIEGANKKQVPVSKKRRTKLATG